MKHKYMECNCYQHFCPICNGGLAICEVCGAAECELTTDCPGFKLGETIKERICRREVDYINGTWIDK